MPATEYVLQLEEQGIEVTPEEVRKAGQLFWRGRSNGTSYEELVLDISRKLKTLRPFIGVVKKDKNKNIAMLVKVLTRSRSLHEAKEYLKTEDGIEWLRRQWKGPEAPSEAAVSGDAANEPENPTIAVTEPEPIVFTTRQVADPLHRTDLRTESVPGSLEGLPATAIPFGPAELELPTAARPVSPASPRRSSAHSPTPSDMSVDHSAQRCPRCQQIHPDNLLALAILQVLEHNGYGADGQRSSRSALARQTRRANGDRVISSANVAPGSPTVAVEPQLGIPARGPARRQRWYIDVIVMVWLFALTLVYMDILPRHASKAS
ncbi:hypothetical protein E8E11_008979 [Didymella keratinophila]|nr:hypothetical protein E8E11_008979 [Didymella keratinophila]